MTNLNEIREQCLKVARDWKSFWMNQNDEADRSNYFNRAFDVDANMTHHLADMFAKHIESHLKALCEVKVEGVKTPNEHDQIQDCSDHCDCGNTEYDGIDLLCDYKTVYEKLNALSEENENTINNLNVFMDKDVSNREKILKLTAEIENLKAEAESLVDQRDRANRDWQIVRDQRNSVTDQLTLLKKKYDKAVAQRDHAIYLVGVHDSDCDSHLYKILCIEEIEQIV